MKTFSGSDIAFTAAVALFLGWAIGVDVFTSTVDTPPPAPVVEVVRVNIPGPTETVFVPAGPNVCPEEDSCDIDWDGERWIVRPILEVAE